MKVPGSVVNDERTWIITPWLRAISTDRALDILKMEVGDGLLDPALVDTFIDAKVFERAGVLRT